MILKIRDFDSMIYNYEKKLIDEITEIEKKLTIIENTIRELNDVHPTVFLFIKHLYHKCGAFRNNIKYIFILEGDRK